MNFVSCAGREACTEDGTHCRGCGRSHEEIAKVRALVNAVADHALAMEYENVETFAAWVAEKAVRKVAFVKSRS